MTILRSVAPCALAIIMLGSAATAHVTIAPRTLAPGATSELAFRCPDERPDSDVTEFAVQMPPDTPLTDVVALPMPGWHVSIATRRLATPIRVGRRTIRSVVDTLTWTGGSIHSGSAATFRIMAGPMPLGVAEIAFKAVQIYANGDAEHWVELRNPGEPAPQFPAPLLQLR